MKIEVATCLSKDWHPNNIAHALGLDRFWRNSIELPKDQKPDVVFFASVSPSQKEIVHQLRGMGIKTIGYWMGQDSLNFRNFGDEPVWPIFDRDVCVHQRNVEDLSVHRRSAEVIPFFTPFTLEESPQPKEKSVAVYFPSTKDKYCGDVIRVVAEACPELPFILYGGGDTSRMPGNVFSKPWLLPEEATEVLRRCSVLLRWTTHDGFPQNIIEAKMLGRNVISNYHYKGCMFASAPAAVVEILKSDLAHRMDFSGWPLIYRTQCSMAAFRERVLELAGWMVA